MSAASASAETRDPAARGSLRLLADPVFGAYFGGRLLSTAGVWIHNIVAAILAYELSGSALVVGLVSVAQFGPQLLLAPLSGALADRGDRRRQLVLGRLVVALGSGGLALLLALVGVDGLPGVWPVLLAALVVGLGFVVVSPAQNALIPALVRAGELPPAIALNAVPPTIARAVGPAVGALVAVSLGPATAFAIAAVANVAFALVVWPLNVRSRADNGGGTDHRVRAAVRYLGEDRGIGLLLAGVAAIGIGADPVITLTPSLSATFGAGSGLVGLFASAFGVGAGVAFLGLSALRGWLGLPMVGTTRLGLLAVGTVLAGVSPTPSLVVVSLGVAGAGMTLSLTSLSTQLQERLPDELRGRVMALWSVAFLGSRPFAATLNGGLADALAPVVSFTVVGAIVGVAAWICRPSMLAARPVPNPSASVRQAA